MTFRVQIKNNMTHDEWQDVYLAPNIYTASRYKELRLMANMKGTENEEIRIVNERGEEV